MDNRGTNIYLYLESQYFGSIDYFKKFSSITPVEIPVCEPFQKSTLRNRCVIAGSNGLINLTVPILGGREQKALMKDIKIDHSVNWRKIHCRSIQSSYAKSSFYDYYSVELLAMLTKQHKYLLDLNMELLNWLIARLQLKIEVGLSTEHAQPVSELKKAKIGDATMQQGWRPVYFQVFQDKFGFQPNLCILDLLFAEGPNAGRLIKDSV